MGSLSNIIYGLSGVLAFSLFDYFGFNLSLNKNWADFSLFNKYRFFQATFQVVLSVSLYFLSRWQSVAAFNIIWWTWGCDFIFYLLCEIFNYGNDRGNFKKEVSGNNVLWAWWTPYGLMFTRRGDVITKRILITQALIGLLISIIICFI